MRIRWYLFWSLLVLFVAGVCFGSQDDPSDIRTLIQAAGSSEDHQNANVVIVFDRTDVDVEDSGLAHIVNHTVTKILTETGARDHAMLRFDYDPATQAVEIRHVNIHRKDGTIIPVNLADLVDVSAPAHAIYWGGRMQALALPRLNVGDAIESETYRKGFQIAYLNAGEVNNVGGTGGKVTPDEENTARENKYIPPMEGHFYDVVLFQSRVPIKEKSYRVHTPKDKPIQYSVYNGEVFSSVTFDDEKFRYKFWKKDVPAAEHEWRSTGFSDYAPKVVLATVQDWYEKSRWFWEVNQNQFADNDEIRQKVAEITKGLKTEAEKIAAINHWVAQEIRYCGLNMGKGEGYTLHPGEMIFAERSGVCKDIAGMTITMLRSAGYEVYPAMTMAGSRVERIPADQFNHCVAALKRSDGTFELLDPTWIPFAMSNWSRAEGEQNYVIGTPTGEDLTITPAYRPEDNLVTFELDTEVTENGTLRGTMHLQASGYADTRLRRSVGFVPKSRIRPRLENWLATLSPSAELVSYEFGDHRDFSEPLSLKLEFRIAGYATVGKTRVILRPCATRLVMGNYGGLFRFAAPDLPDERTQPALIWYPQQVTINETIKMPKGYLPQPLIGDWQSGTETDIASCRFNHRAGKKQLAIEGTIRVEKRFIPPEAWPVFKATVQMLQDFGTTKIVAMRKGA